MNTLNGSVRKGIDLLAGNALVGTLTSNQREVELEPA